MARTHWKLLITLPSGQIPHLRRTDGTVETLYLTGDHLGSIDVVTGAGGVVKHRASFATYGQRRNAVTWSGALLQNDWQEIANNIRRRYTGHEHLYSIGLTHMNGQVYDPAIGRFLSADPIADGLGTPRDNRYAYVGNRSLSITDPSGYAGCGNNKRPLSNAAGGGSITTQDKLKFPGPRG